MGPSVGREGSSIDIRVPSKVQEAPLGIAGPCRYRSHSLGIGGASQCIGGLSVSRGGPSVDSVQNVLLKLYEVPLYVKGALYVHRRDSGCIRGPSVSR